MTLLACRWLRWYSRSGENNQLLAKKAAKNVAGTRGLVWHGVLLVNLLGGNLSWEKSKSSEN